MDTIVFRVEHEHTGAGPYDGGAFYKASTWAEAQGDGPYTDFSHVPREIWQRWHYGCPTLGHLTAWFGERTLDKIAAHGWHAWAFLVDDALVKLAISGIQVIFKREEAHRIWKRKAGVWTPPPPPPPPPATWEADNSWMATYGSFPL